MKNVHRRHQIALRRKIKGWVGNPRKAQAKDPSFRRAAAREAILGINPKYLHAPASVRPQGDPPARRTPAAWEGAEKEWAKKYDGRAR